MKIDSCKKCSFFEGPGTGTPTGRNTGMPICTHLNRPDNSTLPYTVICSGSAGGASGFLPTWIVPKWCPVHLIIHSALAEDLE